MSNMPPIKVEYITPDGKPHAPQQGCSPKESAAVPPPAVETIMVNGVPISAEAIYAEVQHHPGAEPQAVVKQAAQALVVRELLLQEARKLDVSVEAQTDASGAYETADDVLIRGLLEQEISHPQATEEDCQRYFDTHQHRFCSEPIYEVRHILISASPDDEKGRAVAKSDAEAMLQQLQDQSASFTDLAAAHSVCPSREQGGNLGQLTRGSTVPEFEQALAGAEQGKLIPEPVATRYGYHIVQADRIIKGELLPFSAVQDKIAAWLEASSWSRGVSQFIGTLAGKADIEGFEMGGNDTPLVQ